MRETILTQCKPDIKALIWQHFVKFCPDRYGYACDNHFPGNVRNALNALDYLDFHYRRYLIGFHKTLHRVMYELRNSCINHGHSIYVIQYDIFETVESIIMENELYELMPGHLKAKKKILTYLNKLNSKSEASHQCIVIKEQ